MSKAKKGEFVEYFPNKEESETTPAIVVKENENGTVHLNVFTADTHSSNPVKAAFNVPHASASIEGQHYWDYFEE
jgi:hypothetical protein